MNDKSKNKMLLILGLMIFLANGDNYAVAPLIINISRDLNISISTAALSVTAYMTSFGVFTLIFGPLSDRYGKAKIINIAAVGTAIFSILGATAFNLPSLLFFRAMNGAFGAGIFPVTLALVGETFDEQNRQKSIAKILSFSFLGSATATIIGGFIAYYASWRMVYLVYGLAELSLAIVMLKMLQRDKPVTSQLRILSSYKEALSHKEFWKVLTLLLFVGIAVFGSFTYSGQLIKEATSYSVLAVGLILSLFGIGTLVAGKWTNLIKSRLNNMFLPMAGLIGAASLLILSRATNVLVLGSSFFFFGTAFIFIQPTLIAKTQELLSGMKGTAMALASFCVFGGGAIGTTLNGFILDNYGISIIFIISSVLILMTGILGGILSGIFNSQTIATEVE